MKHFQAIIISHVGNTRKNQEDNFLVGKMDYLDTVRQKEACVCPICQDVNLDNSDKSNCAFVFDGMGGHAHGEVASQTAAQLMSKHYDDMLKAAAVGSAAIQDVISLVNDEFCAIANSSSDLRTMGTTLCGIVVTESKAYAVNVGDSRLYSYANGYLKQITVDHTEGQRLLNLGFLTEDEVKRFPKRKALYRYIGQEIKLRPDVFEVKDILPGTVILLATDGLTDVLSDAEIRDVIHQYPASLKETGIDLVEKAVRCNPGYGDNITLMMIAF